ncbi:MAG: hypothetical protein ACO270_07235, partial [Burkholderiaceae bacterium]
ARILPNVLCGHRGFCTRTYIRRNSAADARGSGGFKCDRTGDLALPSSMSVERLSETLGRSY